MNMAQAPNDAPGVCASRHVTRIEWDAAVEAFEEVEQLGVSRIHEPVDLRLRVPWPQRCRRRDPMDHIAKGPEPNNQETSRLTHECVRADRAWSDLSDRPRSQPGHRRT